MTAFRGLSKTLRMPPSFLRPGQVLMLLVLLAASGGHWMVLQSLAWTRMLVSYSHDGQLIEAVAKTFDGQHPCSLCKTIEQGKSSEKQAPTMDLESKASFLVPATVRVVRVSGVSWKVTHPQVVAESRAEQPSVPPPRSALA